MQKYMPIKLSPTVKLSTRQRVLPAVQSNESIITALGSVCPRLESLGVMLLLLALLLSPPAARAQVTWGAPTLLGADTDVSTSGTLVFAYDWANSTRTVNGVTFTGSTSTTTVGTHLVLGAWGNNNTTAFTASVPPFSSLSAAYQGMLVGSDFNNSASGGVGTNAVTLANLALGHNYEVQFWVSDPRSCCSARTETLGSAGGNAVTMDFGTPSAVAGGVGEYSIGAFLATGTSQTFSVGVTTGSVPQINALQLRDLGLGAAAVPPIFNPAAAGYLGAQTVTITGEAGATVFYTTNGATPNNTSLNGGVGTGSATVNIPVSTTVTIKAYETNAAQTDSAVASAAYTTYPASFEPAWNNLAGGSWASPANWLDNVIGQGNGITADFSKLTLSSNATVTLDGSWTIGNLIFGDEGNAFTWTILPGTGGTLTLAAGSNMPAITLSNQTTTISASVAGANGLILNAPGPLSATGAGTLILTAGNTYTGPTIINGGVFELWSGGNLTYTGSNIFINNGSTMLLANDRYNFSNKTITFDTNGGGTFEVTATGSGGFVFLANNTWVTTGGAQDILSTPNGGFFNMNNDVANFIVTRGSSPASDLDVTGVLANSTAGITMSGNGILELDGANTMTGPVVVSNGTALVNGSLAGAATVLGGALGGSGTLSGPVTIQSAGTLMTSPSGISPLAFNSSLSLAGNVNLRLNSSSAINDQLQGMHGVIYGGTLTVTDLGSSLALGNTFTLFTLASGTYSGAFSHFSLPALQAGLNWDVSQLTVNGSITVVNTTPAPTFLLAGPLGTQTVSINCLTPSATIYYTTDGSTPTTSSPVYATPIPLAVGAHVTINAIAKAASFGASGVATFSYTAYGEPIWASTAGGSWVFSGNWSNSIVGQGAGVTADFSELTLTANATVTLDSAPIIGGLVFGDAGNAYTWTVNPGIGGPLTLAATPSPVITVANQTATIAAPVAGANGLTLDGPGTLIMTGVNTYSGPTIINGGVLDLVSGVNYNYPGGGIFINNGATMEVTGGRYNFTNITFTFDTNGGGTLAALDTGYGGFVFEGNNTYVTSGGAQDTISSPTATTGGFNMNGFVARFMINRGANPVSDLAVTAPLGNSGAGITMSGNGIMELDGVNTYPGPTMVSNGTLVVNGSIAGATTVMGGAMLVNGTTGTGSVVVQGGGALGGTGTINGPVTVQSGGALMTSPSGINTLNVASTLNLAGTVNLRINASAPANDLISEMTRVTYGGSLTVSNLGGSPALGNTFYLFSANAFSGGFSHFSMPALPAGLSWDVTPLTVNGSITVVNYASTPVFNPSAENYVGTQPLSVTISSLTPGATVYYTTNGDTPTTGSSVYSSPIVLPVNTSSLTIQAMAVASGQGNSAVASATYATEAKAVWTWNTNVPTGSWSLGGDWTNGIVPNNSGATADFSALALGTNTDLTLDGAWTVGNLIFGDRGNLYSWELDAGGNGALTLAAATTPVITVSNQTTTITAPIGGVNGLLKSGAGTLVLSGANSYGPGSTISQGTLEISNLTSSGSGPITLGDANTGTNAVQLTLDPNTPIVGFGELILSPINVSTNGTGPATITLTEAGNVIFYVDLNLNRPTTINASNLAGYGLAFPITGNVGTLTINGGNSGSGLGVINTPNTFTGTIIIASGIVNSYTSSFGAANPVVLQGDSTWLVENAYSTPSVYTIGYLSGTGLIESGSPQSLSIGNDNGSGSFAGVIEDGSGQLSVIKTGSGSETFSGDNTYSGTTTVSNGTLLIAGSIGAGAVTVAGGTLGGNGTIGGATTIQSGGTLETSPTAAVGTLTIDNSLTLNAGSVTLLKVNKAAATNDALAGISALTYGGTLTVANVGGTLAAGDSFTLFNAATYAGNFAATTLPPLNPGLAWNWTPTNGALAVVSSSVPVLSGIAKLSATSFSLTFSGLSGLGYTVLMTTNLTVPPTNWTHLANGTFGASLVNFTDSGATNAARFYRIVSP